MMPSLNAALFEKLESLNEEPDSAPAILEQPLDKHAGWPEHDNQHCLSRRDLLALMAALGAGRPLLITGEPGCGKSHTARAYASLLHFDFLAAMIKPGSKYDSLLWQIDHVKRLAEAQVLGAGGREAFDTAALEINNFRHKGVVWKAFENTAKKGTVLLLDEIDKAELTLVNGLLDVLDQGSFPGPDGEQISRAAAHPLLVILTSNGDRLMPPAVIRRCAQHRVELPKDKKILIDHFVAISEAKFPSLKGRNVLRQSANTIASHRDPDAKVRPGVSEYIDLLRAWQAIEREQNEGKANKYLDDLSGFFLKRTR